MTIPTHIVTGRTLTRRNMEAAISAAKGPVLLTDCDFEGVDLSRLDLTGFSFERCTLIEADLSHAKASGTTWTSCRSRKAQLRGADLTDARIIGGDWNNSDWQEASLAGIQVNGVKLTGADLRGVKAIGASFRDCPMQSAILIRMSFRKDDLGRCDMTRADVRECDFRGASFAVGSSLAHALIDGARFEDADLREADLTGHGIDSLKRLSGARISMAQASAMVTAAGLRVG